MASSSTGRIPQGEVIIEFGDGGTYVKHRLEAAVLDIEKRRVQKEEGEKAQKAMEALEVSKASGGGGGGGGESKSSDVDYLTAQFGCTKSTAESALKDNNGDLVKAVMQFVEPRPRARSVDGGAEIRR